MEPTVHQKLIDFLKNDWEIPHYQTIEYPDGTGYAGIDLDVFFEMFAEKFGVDMTEFDWNDYYACDADVLNFPKAFYLSIFKPHELQKKHFNFQHLLAVAECRRWFDPPTKNHKP